MPKTETFEGKISVKEIIGLSRGEPASMEWIQTNVHKKPIHIIKVIIQPPEPGDWSDFIDKKISDLAPGVETEHVVPEDIKEPEPKTLDKEAPARLKSVVGIIPDPDKITEVTEKIEKTVVPPQFRGKSRQRRKPRKTSQRQEQKQKD